MTFDVVVSNPCVTATINNIVFNPVAITVSDGSTATATFSTPTDSVDASNTVSNLCGAKSYTIKDSTGTVITTWASISTATDGTHTLTIDTD